MIHKGEALKILCPNAEWSVSGDEVQWLDKEQSQPSEKAIQAKLAELQADYDAKSYARARASAFPSITDVVVALAEKQEGDDTMWKEITAKRAKVKSDNPKPE